MKLAYSNKAKKQLLKLPKKEQIKILKRVRLLKNNLFLGKKLKGKFKGLFSFRVWPYRIIYQEIKKQKIIFVVTIEYRQSVYK